MTMAACLIKRGAVIARRFRSLALVHSPECYDVPPLQRCPMTSAYITHLGKCLPGEPIPNDEMEAYLGCINGKPSKVKRRILASNGIRQRHYALDRQQHTTHLNHEMAAIAIRDALTQGNLDPAQVDLLCAATTWPDLLVPGFASMVHGSLPELPPLEATSHQGVCCTGVAALKYATAQVARGDKRCAVTVASELASRLFKHRQFETHPDLQAGKALPFDTEFLRWMLSDGAGAMVVRDRPDANGLSLKVDWIELVSHASNHPLCMYAGTADGQGDQELDGLPQLHRRGCRWGHPPAAKHSPAGQGDQAGGGGLAAADRSGPSAAR
jgi:3-oxoacyl-[acyl-carrier-protein] synthase-3